MELVELTEKERTFLVNILNQIQVPLNAPDGPASYLTGRSILEKLTTVADKPGPPERPKSSG